MFFQKFPRSGKCNGRERQTWRLLKSYLQRRPRRCLVMRACVLQQFPHRMERTQCGKFMPNGGKMWRNFAGCESRRHSGSCSKASQRQWRHGKQTNQFYQCWRRELVSCNRSYWLEKSSIRQCRLNKNSKPNWMKIVHHKRCSKVQTQFKSVIITIFFHFLKVFQRRVTLEKVIFIVNLGALQTFYPRNLRIPQTIHGKWQKFAGWFIAGVKHKIKLRPNWSKKITSKFWFSPSTNS